MLHTDQRVTSTLHPARRMLACAAVIAACVLGATPAVFAGDDHAGTHNFKSADRDGDGRLNRDEYDQMSRNPGATTPPAGEGVPATEHQANVLNHFEDHDRDGDGYISAAEFDSKSQSGSTH